MIKPKTPPTFRHFAASWIFEREEQFRIGELALQTIRTYRRSVNGILIPELGDYRVDEINHAMLRTLHVQYRERPAAANMALDLARRILFDAEADGLRPTGILKTRMRRHPELMSARPATSEEVLKLFLVCAEIRAGRLDVCHPTMAALFQAVAITGARPSEMRMLPWTGVDMFPDYAILRLKKHKTVRKMGEKRIVLDPIARGVILSMVPNGSEEDVWVFPSHVNPGRPYRDVTKAWRRVAKCAGVDDACLRDLRSGLATNAYENGVPLEQIQEMLGHQSIATTRRYTRISSTKVVRAYTENNAQVFSSSTRRKKRGRNE